MARVTVEDCLEVVPNRFALVHLASRRARDLIKGDTPTVEHAKNKETVLALREVAANHARFAKDVGTSLRRPVEDLRADYLAKQSEV
ncbi:MAG: DNA-directed RNA polymerase subunit omega [Myxococcales bacterium]|nr:DNA-directed RNA polymerase subunit omega [Myxococcales bacterium]